MAMGQRSDIPLRNHRILKALSEGTAIEDVADEYQLTVGYIAFIAREAGYRPAHDLPADGSLSERDQFIVARAMDGETFTDIGRDYGVSRERVRQIVKKRTGVGARDGLMSERAKRRREIVLEHARRLIADNVEMSASDVANEVGLRIVEVQTLMGKDEALRRRPSRQITVGVSDDEILREMRRVAELPGGSPLAAAFYDQHRSPGSVGQVRILQRLGTWREACALAGVSANEPVRSAYNRRWDREQLLGWVLGYIDTTDRPTYSGMDAWLRTQDDAPSAQTVRNYIGGWIEVLREAVEYRRRQGVEL